MPNDYTVLNDWAGSGESSHQEIAEQLLPRLKEEMPEERMRSTSRRTFSER